MSGIGRVVRNVVSLLVGATLVLPLLPLGTAFAVLADGTRAGGRAVVGDEVRTRLAGGGRARVMVFLASPDAQGSLEESKRSVAKAQATLLKALDTKEFELKRRFETVPAVAIEITASALRKIEAISSVVRVDLDEGGAAHLAEAVPLTNSDDVQALGYTGLGVTVAILDSGIDRDHPDPADALGAEACFCGNNCCPNGLDTRFGPGAAEDDVGHGTHVAGIVTSNGVVSPRGVAPDAGIVAVKVLGSDNTFCCTSDIVAGLDWVFANQPEVDVINMSLGTFALFSGYCDNATADTMALARAINQLRSRGVMSFASSGNNASGTQMGAPACVENTLSVGAVYDANFGPISYGNCSDSTTAADKVTCFTNTNSTTDMFAPGAPIRSDYLGGGTAILHGTSMASPHAAGCAANLRHAEGTLDPLTIESALESTGHPVVDVTNGLTFPRIDCLAALNSLVFPAGRVPSIDTAEEPALRVMRTDADHLALTWGASCLSTDIDYEIYEGALGSFESHEPLLCSTGGSTSATILSTTGSRYYLVVPRNVAREGSFGTRSDGSERPAGPSPCFFQLIDSCPSPP